MHTTLFELIEYKIACHRPNEDEELESLSKALMDIYKNQATGIEKGMIDNMFMTLTGSTFADHAAVWK